MSRHSLWSILLNVALHLAWGTCEPIAAFLHDILNKLTIESHFPHVAKVRRWKPWSCPWLPLFWRCGKGGLDEADSQLRSREHSEDLPAPGFSSLSDLLYLILPRLISWVNNLFYLVQAYLNLINVTKYYPSHLSLCRNSYTYLWLGGNNMNEIKGQENQLDNK